jgi:ribose transport system permease protein
MSEIGLRSETEAGSNRRGRVKGIGLALFEKFGVLPVLLILAVVVFSQTGAHFLSTGNLLNLFRQSVFLIVVSLGQFLVLITGGFDLSVGSLVSLTSVTSALVMVDVFTAYPAHPWIAILLGCGAALLASAVVGVFNGTGVAIFGVSPFIMTLGSSMIATGITLFVNGGVPIYGMPPIFSETFGVGSVFGIPSSVLVALLLMILTLVLSRLTRFGRYLYAVGGNPRAAQLSGVRLGAVLMITYPLCAMLASLGGLLLTAKLGTGETNIGGAMSLQTVTACVIGGVSLSGGVGRVENVVLGALFITMVENGMNLARVGSYAETIALGAILILAVIVDRIRAKLLGIGNR